MQVNLNSAKESPSNEDDFFEKLAKPQKQMNEEEDEDEDEEDAGQAMKNDPLSMLFSTIKNRVGTQQETGGEEEKSTEASELSPNKTVKAESSRSPDPGYLTSSVQNLFSGAASRLTRTTGGQGETDGSQNLNTTSEDPQYVEELEERIKAYQEIL
jgi:hypothetical protein